MIRWADPEAVEDAVREHAAELRRHRSGITRIYWYGSWVSGRPTPSSDVDLCVVVEEDGRRPRHRIPDFLPARFPVGVDLVVFTEDEFESLPERAPTWHEAIVSGREM